MDLLSNHPYWPIKDGLPAAYPSLKRDEHCEVAVIGAGITGALAAWQLAEAGIDTVVLDRRDVAHGSTSGSTSLLQYEIDLPLHRLAHRLGRIRAERAYHGCLKSIHDLARLVKTLKIDCGFAFKGSLFLASKRADIVPLRREYEARLAAGFDVAWWPRGELARRSSLPQPAAIFSAPGEAAQVDAYSLTHGLLAAAEKKGARVYDQTTVVRTHRNPRGIELTTQRKTRVRAKWVVVASGYEADQFLPERVTTLHSTYAIASEPVEKFPGWPEGEPVIWDTADPYIYLRTTPDRRIIMGGYDEPFRDPVKRDQLLTAKAALLQRRFRQLFPRIPFELATAWAGTFGKTADGLPFIGEYPGIPRTWFALGYGGNGITYSVIAAQLLRDRLTEGVSIDADLYGFDRQPSPSRN
ncbi:MAG TPA: FAD-dependent oxidoreductase [Lacunisphaera sp.]|jgi:glycine/D-amino acid oxidase-like deaminating enzyme